MTSREVGLVSSSVRAGYPDFLDLPWTRPMALWEGQCDRLEMLPRGLGRHPVVFVSYEGAVYALKELPVGLAEREYGQLRRLEDARVPCVTPVGHAMTRTDDGDRSVLVTRYLDHSLPYHSLFMRPSLTRYRNHLLGAMALLLVQLHLAGAFWGDCSLNNTLFRRDAGRLTAYLVDAETAEVHASISDGMRKHDLDIMEENVSGGLLDLAAMGALPADFPAREIGETIRQQYQALWETVTAEQLIPFGERYRIRERVRRLNELGFSVDQIELQPAPDGEMLRLRALVTDRYFHRNMLHSMTGLDPEEMQAQAMLNEIQQMKASLSAQLRRSVPLSVAAHRWLNEVYMPVLDKLALLVQSGADPAELYCQLLEHKWYLSERAAHDVGHLAAAEDFMRQMRDRPSLAGVTPLPDADEPGG